MAHLLNVKDITVIYGDRTVLDHVSLGLDDGARIGVVGRNGDGKSTLLRVLSGRQEPDSGRVTPTGGLRVGMLTQADELAEGITVRRAVVGDLPDHEWASQPQIREVISGLLSDIDTEVPDGFDAPVDHLSGGQRRRVALASVLVNDHDLIILDEPTNHLDIDGVTWLASHLNSRWHTDKGALLVVTHDRWFLDAVSKNTWEVHDAAVDFYDGGYAAYILARNERMRRENVAAQRRDNLLRKELAWLRRGAPARTSKPKFRIDAAAELISNEPPPRDGVELLKVASTRLGKDVIDFLDVSYAISGDGRSRQLLDDVEWRIGPGDRIGILGPNGAGKTTLLKLITGDAEPDAGRVKKGKTVSLGVLTQDLAQLDAVADDRVIDVLGGGNTTVQIGADDMSASGLLERLGFTGQQAWTRVRDLSGGQRRRLQLARLLMTQPNVLIMDEPTNDLDTETLAATEDVLDGFAGTLLVVSHDRYLLQRVTDRQVGIFGDGKVRDLPGGVEQYLTVRAKQLREKNNNDGSASSQSYAAVSDEGTTSGRASSAGSAQQRVARKAIARLEKQLNKLTAQRDKLHHTMAESAHDHAELSRLDAELTEVLKAIENTEIEWLEAADQAGV